MLVARSSLFLNQWLVSRLGEDVGPKATFFRFKHFIEHESGSTVHDMLREIEVQADTYRGWAQHADDETRVLSRIELHVYRTQSAQTEVLKPLLLWLTAPTAGYSDATVDRVVGVAESWLMRRLLLRGSTSDHGRVVADLIRSHRGTPDAELVERVEGYFARLNVASTYWPGDEEIRNALAVEPAYRRYPRQRLRMFLQAVEDHLRGFTEAGPSFTGHRIPRSKMPIEHLLPQQWRQHWPVPDVQAELDRDARVHRLGNLTLLTTALNSSVSNGPWLGAGGKRERLQKHDALLMTRSVREDSAAGWSEEHVDERTTAMIEALLATWPVPGGHEGRINDRPAAGAEVTLRELMTARALTPGTVLTARQAEWADARCEITADGRLLLESRVFDTPSGAAFSLRRKATNGWWFWRLPDGRRLSDVRAAHLSNG